MGRPAARDLDDHTCPMKHPAAHEGGPIAVGRACTVIVGGSPAAGFVDLAMCQAGPPDMILMGSPNVLVQELPAARKYDPTFHGGMILEGEPTVLIGGDSPATLLLLAILRIQNSKYGQTDEGKKVVEALYKKRADGKLSSAQDLPPEFMGVRVAEDPEPGQSQGSWDKKDNVVLDEDGLDDVDGTADTLVHEGKHEQGGKEIEAREETLKLYEEQEEHGYDNPEAEADRKAIEEDRIEERLEEQGYPPEKWR